MKKELFDALLKIQQEVEDLKKDKKNPFFKSSYADLNQVLDNLQPLFTKYKLVVLQLPTIHEGKSVLNTKIIHEIGDEIECFSELKTINDDPQKLGSAITYMRRYSLISIFGLKSEDDDGNSASGNFKQKQHADIDWSEEQAQKSYDDCISILEEMPLDSDVDIFNKKIASFRETLIEKQWSQGKKETFGRKVEATAKNLGFVKDGQRYIEKIS